MTTNAEIGDIVAPSLFLSISGKSKPFSLMLGYQKDVVIENGEKMDGYFLSFGFDLPILRLY